MVKYEESLIRFMQITILDLMKYLHEALGEFSETEKSSHDSELKCC